MSRNTWLFLLLLTLPALACRAGSAIIGKTVQGSGNVIEENRPVSGITSVELATTGTLHIEVGTREALRVEAEANLMPYIQTEVRGEQLRIDIAEGVNIRKTKPINYYLTVIEMDAITITSSGDIVAPTFEGDEFQVGIFSSGDLTIDALNVAELNIDIGSSGEVRLGEFIGERIDVDINSSGNVEIQSGRVKYQKIDIGSSGDYNARAVDSLEADVDINSSGTVTIRVSERLEASINSSGNVYYIGDPQIRERRTSSGQVIQLDD